jgi:subtilisin family serine protease
MIRPLNRSLAPIICITFFLLGAVVLQAQVASVVPLTPAPSAGTGIAVNETPSLWFVELNSAPTADGTPLATVRQEKANFRAAAAAARLTYQERFAFDTLWNGLSVRINPSDVSKLARIPGVAAIYPVGTFSLPPTQNVSEPDLITALAMTGADVAQSQLGLTGQGVKVGIIDTGIDYDHPDLGGNGVDGIAHPEAQLNFPTARVIAGYDFVGDAYNSSGTSDQQVPHADPYPYDCAGHGTHVAGIVGANGAVKGVAPNVQFGAYRVFGCSGTTNSDVMIQAMERAFADGMQVINMSIGAANQWPQYPTARAATRLVNKGVVVVASIGNDGATGLYAASAPGVGSKVIGVASFDNTHLNLSSFTYSSANLPVGYISATGAPPAPLSGNAPLARTGTPTTTNDGCTALPAGSLTGTVALIRRGTCSFYIKATNAMAAGAIGVILYNNASGLVSPTVAGTPPVTIPVVAISAADGAAINNAVAAAPTAMTWSSTAVSLPNATGGLISSFSSYGVSPDLTLKPDIGAPGGFVRSTYPINLGSYANLSGTSMSSPHVTGAVALLLQNAPHTPSQAVRDILQNSAMPAMWWGNPTLGFLDNTQRQGAGMLQIDKAVLNTTRVSPAKLSLGDTKNGPVTQSLTISNSGSTTVTYTLAHVPALSTKTDIFTPTFTTGFATVDFSQSTVTLPPGGSTTVDVTVTPNAALPDLSMFGGYIVISPGSSGEAVHVPYAGLKGNYQAMQAMTPTANGFPWLAKLIGTNFFNEPNGASYSLQNGDVPYFLLHFDHQAQWLRMELFDATTGRSWHRILQENYMPRNSSSTGFFAFTWDGTTYNGTKTNIVPNGNYVVTVTVLRALGDESDPTDVETWTSPVITLARP